MKKKLFYLLSSFAFIFANCPIKDGEIIEIPCKVVDMQGKPIQGVTLSLVSVSSNDSTIFSTNKRLETQKVTDSNGEATFTYEHSRLLRRFVRGEEKGRLSAIELFELKSFTGTQVKPIIRYDSLVPITIRLTSTLPSMKNGQMQVFAYDREANDPRLLNRNFSISSTRVDTIFKAEMFSILQFNVYCRLNLQDTFRQKSIYIPKDGKRDTVFTIVF